MQPFSQKELTDARSIAAAHDRNGQPEAQVNAVLAAALAQRVPDVGSDAGLEPEADALQHEVLAAVSKEHGQLELPDAQFLQLGRRIHDTDKSRWPELAARFIACALRLKLLPVSGRAVEQLIALAAIALGDVPLNGALCRELYARR